MSIEAVIFDWGGTLTPWHTIDFAAEAQALALAAVGAGEAAATLLERANQEVWGWSRDHQRSSRIVDIFDAAGLTHDQGMLTAYREFWEPHTLTDPEVPGLFRRLRDDGLRIGILSNTVWPRDWHEEYFRRDEVLDLIDGAVYTSEIAWTKPAPQAFQAAMEAVGIQDPARCAFVGDRLFDDIWGASSYGMHTIYVPHSAIPLEQAGHTQGEPDAVVYQLSEVYEVVRGWVGG
jgi:putative hydrolase of the HAD superfamily